ncbi:glucans biosynthesis glucosyltransferase MdoH [Salinarimonas ramus]|uniref:Glucans biosynthesis glucosyltransferase H n=1 Tax=Salinarimonas ramus TaxID=690164 RepID=A0A917V2J0_9HYPH|nr:glucans biosynthesis glucosyltransferase MdoH [Salinarimonas ramus]GGK28733.1 glucans biosynthesis glucosyltransferase H [Salinarimonas ramus]
MTAHPVKDFDPALPPEAPLAMPVQDLGRVPPRRGPLVATHATYAARAAAVVLAVVIAVFLTREMHAVLSVAKLTAIEIVMLALFATTIAWIAFAFSLAVLGTGALVYRRLVKRHFLSPRSKPSTRTAILLPTYNEDPARVFATAVATAESLADADVHEAYDVFVLSDTTDPDVWLAEEAAFLAIRAARRPRARIFYRRRMKNVERKAGNVADWVRRFGGAYPAFIVFDADSVMTPRTLVRMTLALERRPELGLLQTVPLLVGRWSLFARLQQFAARVYGPVMATGLAVFSGDAGNYWGHNAIIRTRAFAECAGLPHLRGTAPFGGPVMSHDFVEAALMRRAGWAIEIDASLSGSWEESPPSLVDLAERDRRWCQGNLQHANVLGAKGLHPVSRTHLVIGILSYLSAPLWLAFLLSGLMLALQAHFVRPDYFAADFLLFPTWPVIDSERALGLFATTMAVLLLPKLFGLLVAMISGPVRRGLGGPLRATGGVVLETLVSALLAPVMMALQSAAVFQILAGRDAGWKAQRRDDGSVPWSEIAKRHRWHTALGVALGVAAFAVSPAVFLWMSPAVVGLVLAIPLSGLTARATPRLAALGLLSTPEERTVPPMLVRARVLRREIAAALGAERDAVARLLDTPALAAFHTGTLPAPATPVCPATIDPPFVVASARLDAAGSVEEAIAAMNRAEIAALLSRRDGIERLVAKARPQAQAA